MRSHGFGRFVFGSGLLIEFFALGMLVGNRWPDAFWWAVAFLVAGSLMAVFGVMLSRPRARTVEDEPAAVHEAVEPEHPA